MNTLIHAQNTTEPFRATRDRVIQDGILTALGDDRSVSLPFQLGARLG